jgi:alkylresorcinol/alkylpyrone synthase
VKTTRYIKGLVAVPGAHRHTQSNLAIRMRGKLAHLETAPRLKTMVKVVYARSGIEHRYFELPLDDLDRREDWYLAVNEATCSLGQRALQSLFASTDVRPADCDALVAVSSSHAGFPSLSRRLQADIGLPCTASAWDLGGLGCAGPTHGLALADMLLGTGQANTVCVVAVDVMGTHGELRRHRTPPDMSELVAHCLASDGAAAMIVSRDGEGKSLLEYREARLASHLWSDALAETDFTACSENQPRISVGPGIRTRLLDETSAFFSDLSDEDGLLMHPGGAALMDSVQRAHPRHAPSVEISRAVMRDNGNLGSPSVLWVLKRALEQRIDLGHNLILFALGPGIVTTALRISEVRAST